MLVTRSIDQCRSNNGYALAANTLYGSLRSSFAFDIGRVLRRSYGSERRDIDQMRNTCRYRFLGDFLGDCHVGLIEAVWVGVDVG